MRKTLRILPNHLLNFIEYLPMIAYFLKYKITNIIKITNPIVSSEIYIYWYSGTHKSSVVYTGFDDDGGKGLALALLVL